MKNQALQHDNQLIHYVIEHRKSVTRRIHLRTAADGSLLVIAPPRMSKRTIHATLQKRVNKVARFLVDAQKRLSEIPNISYQEGEAHLFLGVEYSLEFIRISARSSQVELGPTALRIHATEHHPDRVKRCLDAWYRQQSADYFSARLAVWAGRAPWVGSTLPELRLRKMKRTWGSCSARRVITLNTRLMKAPPACIDYVIAHELCHLKEMNHGSAFYALQQELYPDWQRMRGELQNNAHIYLIE